VGERILRKLCFVKPLFRKLGRDTVKIASSKNTKLKHLLRREFWFKVGREILTLGLCAKIYVH